MAGDTGRQVAAPEVKELRSESAALKEAVAELALENRLLTARSWGLRQNWRGKRWLSGSWGQFHGSIPGNIGEGLSFDQDFAGMRVADEMDRAGGQTVGAAAMHGHDIAFGQRG